MAWEAERTGALTIRTDAFTTPTQDLVGVKQAKAVYDSVSGERPPPAG